jgi:predicted lactoylglutathione lyase
LLGRVSVVESVSAELSGGPGEALHAPQLIEPEALNALRGLERSGVISGRQLANIPVADLDRSKAFFTALGWATDERFGDSNAACFVLDDGVHLMLTTREFSASLGDGSKQIGDPAATTLVAFAFDFPSSDEVDAFIETARGAGAKIGATDDYGFMYQRDFQDPDGHQFAPFWMDPDGPPAT